MASLDNLLNTEATEGTPVLTGEEQSQFPENPYVPPEAPDKAVEAATASAQDSPGTGLHLSTPPELSHAHPPQSQWNLPLQQSTPVSDDTAIAQDQDTTMQQHQGSVPPLIKSETATSARDSIPAFVPVVQVKQELSILPSTETSTNESRGTKRPAPKSAPKKGTAKKGPPAKKQKTDSKAKTKVSKVGTKSETPFSISRASDSPAIEDDNEDEDEDMGSPDPDAEVYCICKKPDTGTFMIGCDGKCEDWFHGKCVGILEKDKALIDRYICPVCVKNGVGVTTWKRMCRREGCRLPARLAKKDEEPSKYCSDECGVLFFRSQLARTRGATGSAGTKKSARKQGPATDSDFGPRGGIISAPELKSLVSSVSTFEDFKKLGDGVLSPPATPSPKLSKREPVFDVDTYLDEAQAQRLAFIQTRKEELRTRHTLLKDQAKMINAVRQAGIRAAEQKGLKPKDICGYDDLVHFEESDFAAWRDSNEGQAALKSGVIEAAKDDEDVTQMQTEEATKGAKGPCMKKKCMKHHDWSKLALETNRSETIENSETMRALEREEGEIRERAGLKARQIQSGDLGGYAVHHTQEATPTADEEMGGTAVSDVNSGGRTDPVVAGDQTGSHEPVSGIAASQLPIEAV